MRTTRTNEARFQVEIAADPAPKRLPGGSEPGWVLDCTANYEPFWFTLDEAEARVRQLRAKDIGARVF